MGEWVEWLKGRVLLLGVGGVLAAWGLGSWLNRPLHPPPGVLAPDEPIQGPPIDTAPWVLREYRILPLADFEIRARVLSTEPYYWDAGAHLSPQDLALGWGPMSDSAVLDHIHIDQGGRWYHWRVSSQPPIPVGEIITHSANMHMIPANGRLAHILKDFRVGQVVHLKGKLVRVQGPDNFYWASSTTRTDSGDGSCELVWVDEAGL